MKNLRQRVREEDLILGQLVHEILPQASDAANMELHLVFCPRLPKRLGIGFGKGFASSPWAAILVCF